MRHYTPPSTIFARLVVGVVVVFVSVVYLTFDWSLLNSNPSLAKLIVTTPASNDQAACPQPLHLTVDEVTGELACTREPVRLDQAQSTIVGP